MIHAAKFMSSPEMALRPFSSCLHVTNEFARVHPREVLCSLEAEAPGGPDNKDSPPRQIIPFQRRSAVRWLSTNCQVDTIAHV